MTVGRALVGHCHALDIRELARRDHLVPGHAFRWCWWGDEEHAELHAAVNVVVGKDGLILDYTDEYGDAQTCLIELERTPCYFGGTRVWMTCPRCGRRAAILYFGNGARRFGCRICYGLAYASQREGLYWGSWNRYLRLSESLKTRPKGMHYKTWYAKLAKAEEVAARHWRMAMPVRMAQLLNTPTRTRQEARR